MKRFIIFCAALVPCACAGMWDVKTVAPMTLGQDSWTTGARLGAISDETQATPLFNSDAESNVITLTLAGRYQAVENLNYPLVITADRVFLDLDSYTVTHTVANENVITFTTGLSDASVFNGYIQNTGGAGTGAGVYIASGCSSVWLHDLTIFGCHCGIHCAGATGTSNDIRNSELTDIRLISNDIGMLLEYASASTIRSCNALYSAQFGFELANSQSNCFYDCNAFKTTGTATASGFKSSDGTSNLFYRCATKQTKSSSLTLGDTVCGFLLTGSEQKSKLVECTVAETDVLSSSTALVTYGIHLAPAAPNGMSLVGDPYAPATGGVFCAHWSPDNSFLACTSGTKVFIADWDGSVLRQFATPTAANALRSVAWSPDGRYLAAGEDATENLYVYSFNGTATTATATLAFTGRKPNVFEWSPNGKYLGVVSWASGTFMMSIVSFDGTTLAEVGVAHDPLKWTSWTSVAWSPDSQYIAMPSAVDNTNQIAVYEFYAEALLSAPIIIGGPFPSGIVSLSWSPCGKYLAAGDSSGNLYVLRFDGTSLATSAYLNIGTASFLFALDWSPDGKYLVAAGGLDGSSNPIKMFYFDGSSLTQVGSTYTAPERVYTLHWSSDGKYIASAENASGGFGRVRVFRAMYGPEYCMLKECRVWGTQASDLNVGRGIVAGGANTLVNNACHNNGVNYSYGIPNVYDGRFEITRSVVQPYDNLSLPGLL